MTVRGFSFPGSCLSEVSVAALLDDLAATAAAAVVAFALVTACPADQVAALSA